MITFKWECPDHHKEYTKARIVTHTVEDEATLDEMLEAYVDFLKGVGYSIPQFGYLQIASDEENIGPEVYPVREDVPAELWGKPVVKRNEQH